MKKAIGIVLTVFVLLSSGCNRDDEIVAALTALDGFTQQLIAKVKSGASPSEGLEAARSYFDSNYQNVSEKMKGIADVAKFQVSDGVMKQMEESVTRNITAVESLKIDFMMLTMSDKALESKLNALVGDYEKLVKGEM